MGTLAVAFIIIVATSISSVGAAAITIQPVKTTMDQNGAVYDSDTICIEMKIGDEFTLTAAE